MAQIIRLRRSSVSGQKPTNSNLELGELALNTTDGKAFMAKSGSVGTSIEELIITNASNTGSINLSGSIKLQGNQTITGSLIVSDGLGYIDTGLIAQNSDLLLTSGSNIYVQDGGIVSASQIWGDGSHLFNIPSSGVTGLELNKIFNGNVSASILNDGTFRVNGDTYINNNLVVSSNVSASQFTGSFKGDGSQLYNVPASGITDLNLISDGSATASISNVDGLKINRNTEITGSLIVSSGSAVFDSSLQLTENSSLILNSGSNLYVYDGGIISGTFKGNGALLTDLTYATTASNTFYGSQTVSGSVIITQDLTVLGSSSIVYVTSSQLDISTNIIKLNAANPGVRYGGLAVVDSGSNPMVSGSFLFDSQKDQWVFVHQSQGITTSSVYLLGPETFDDLGNETYISENRLVKGTGIEHLIDSNITDTGAKVSINSNTEITGSLNVNGDNHSFTGSINVTGSLTLNNSSILVNTEFNSYTTSIDSRIDIIQISTASLNSFTSSINTTIKNKLNTENVVSGSIQIELTGTTGYNTFSSSISSSINNLSGSVASTTLTIEGRLDDIETSTGSLNTFTSSYSTGSFTGSFIGDASQLYNIPLSGITNLQLDKIISGNVSASISQANGFRVNTDTNIEGDLTIDGTLTAREIHVEFVSSSVLYESGSTNFGNTIDDFHNFTGSVNINGTLSLNEDGVVVNTDFNSFTSSVDNRLDSIEISTSSLNSFTSSINTTIKNKLNTENVISGSIQIELTGTTGYNTFSSSISSSIGGLSGSVATTTLTIEGRLDDIETSTGSLNTFTSSYSTGSFTGSFTGDGSGLTSVGQIETVFYVSEDGNDLNDGKTLSTSFRTIKAATLAASSSLALNSGLPVFRQSIHVKTGYYIEEAPVTVPSNVSILGDDLRTVVIRPSEATKTSNLFLMNNGTYCWGLRLEGCVIDSLENPRNGFFFAFAPNAYIVTSPYVQNCSAINTPVDKFYSPLDLATGNPLVGNGPGGLIVDDSVLNGYSPLKSMIVDAYTQVAFNGIGICVRGRGYAQLVSFFTNFSRVGTYCIDGGHASLLNSNTTFGDYGLRSKGLRILVKPNTTSVTPYLSAPDSLLISNNKVAIQSYMITQLIALGNFSSEYSNTGSTIYQSTIRDSGLLIDSIADDLLSIRAARTTQFTQGLFKGQDTSVGSIYTLPATTGFTQGAIVVFPVTGTTLAEDFIDSYSYIKDFIINDPNNIFTGMTASGTTKVSQLLDVPINTLTSVIINNAGGELMEEFGSLITSTSHDFSYAGAGVNFLALPANQGGVGETNIDIRIFEESGGRVFHTSGDETGDFYAGNDFIIRQGTGTIEGRTFSKALSAQFTPLNLALES